MVVGVGTFSGEPGRTVDVETFEFHDRKISSGSYSRTQRTWATFI